jgi:hypothetical protein
MISEQDNSPEEVKNRIRSITKAIRYRARSEGGNMIKAFNDYMGSQGSGIGAQDRQMIKKRLGLSEKFSNWREDLIEVDYSNENTVDKKIKEKKVKNIIKINPNLGEEIEKLGGTIMEMEEIEESMSPKEVQLQKRKTMIDIQVAKERRKQINKASADAPTKEVGESTEDSLRDRRMERGGVDGNNRYNSATKNVAMGGGKKKPYDGMSALEKVKASIRAKHGQGAIMDTKKK